VLEPKNEKLKSIERHDFY